MFELRYIIQNFEIMAKCNCKMTKNNDLIIIIQAPFALIFIAFQIAIEKL